MRHYKIIVIAFLLSIFGCSDLLVNSSNSNLNMDDFNQAWQTAKAYYPFFKFKNINWDSLYIKYKPLAEAAQGDEIYNILYQMFRELKDGHIQILTKGGFPLITYDWPRDIDRKAFSSVVVSRYFSSPLKLAGENYFDYQITDNNIGYVYISTFSDGDGVWYQDLNLIMNYFKTVKGIIVDVRNNGGGNLNPVDYILKCLIQSSITETWYLPSGINRSILNPLIPVNQKPVAVLINGASFSSAEHFPELLRQSKNVTLIGDTTGGGGGRNNIYPLPSGKRIRIAYGYFDRNDGTMVEWNGVLPDILVTQTEADIQNGRDKQFEYAIKYLNR